MDFLALVVAVVASHLLVDFYFQPTSWVQAKVKLKAGAWQLYAHAVLAGALALLAFWIVKGKGYWWVLPAVAIPHFAIDCWKLYFGKNLASFFIDQAMHYFHLFLVILVSMNQTELSNSFFDTNTVVFFALLLVGALFLWLPAGIMVGKLTQQFRDNLNPKDRDKALPNAGKWIGILERLFIYIAILVGQYSAIGFLIAAKSILRYTDSRSVENPIRMSEYVLVGTLISFLLAVVTALLVKFATQFIYT